MKRLFTSFLGAVCLLHYQHVRMKKLRLRNQEVVIQKNCLHFPLKW